MASIAPPFDQDIGQPFDDPRIGFRRIITSRETSTDPSLVRAVLRTFFLLYFFSNCATLIVVTDRDESISALPPIPRRGERRRGRIDLALTFVAVIVLVNAVVGDRGLLETWRARRQHAALVAGISEMRDENRILRDEARRLREDPASIESIARQNLGLIRPGEILVVIRTSNATR